MLRSVKEFENARVRLLDGQGCGRVKDIYFDDQSWAVRFLKVSLDPIRFGHKQVLITLDQVRDFSPDGCELNLNETELAYCPLDSSYLPVCAQYASFSLSNPRHWKHKNTDPHLRSANAVRSYTLYAGTEVAGMAADFLIGVKEWKIQYITVEQLEQKQRVSFLIHPENIERISWSTQRIVAASLAPVLSEPGTASLVSAAAA
jgi:hypothetical protein